MTRALQTAAVLDRAAAEQERHGTPALERFIDELWGLEEIEAP